MIAHISTRCSSASLDKQYPLYTPMKGFDTYKGRETLFLSVFSFFINEFVNNTI